MADVEIEEGKVYLRDTRNGRVHPYEPLLSEMSYMQKFIGGNAPEKVPENMRPAPPRPHLSAAERAAEFDRLARMPNDEREAEMAKIREAEEAQNKTNATAVTPTGEVKKKYTWNKELAGDKTYADFTAGGWTKDQLIEAKYLLEVE